MFLSSSECVIYKSVHLIGIIIPQPTTDCTGWTTPKNSLPSAWMLFTVVLAVKWICCVSFHGQMFVGAQTKE